MPDIVVERRFSAEPGRVWEEFVEPDSLSAWFWPTSFDTTAAIEPRVGGRTRIESRANRMGVSGEVTSVEPGRRLVTTWRWNGEDDVTTVGLTLEPSGSGGTDLQVEHPGFPDAQSADDHVLGWNDCLDRLAVRLG